jgi:hypothetical protein
MNMWRCTSSALTLSRRGTKLHIDPTFYFLLEQKPNISYRNYENISSKEPQERGRQIKN